MTTLSPLPLDDDHWCSRWLVLPKSWNRLHRVASITWDDDESCTVITLNSDPDSEITVAEPFDEVLRLIEEEA